MIFGYYFRLEKIKFCDFLSKIVTENHFDTKSEKWKVRMFPSIKIGLYWKINVDKRSFHES